MFGRTLRLPTFAWLLFAAVLWAGWRASRFYGATERHDEAIVFCESLVPRLAAYKQEHGSYPVAIPPEWIGSRAFPDLIRPEDFYLQYDSGQNYLLRFRDPATCLIGLLCDDIYGLGPESPYSGRWLNYDGD